MTQVRSIFNRTNHFYHDRPRERSRASYLEDDEYNDEEYDPRGSPYASGRSLSPTPVYYERDLIPRHSGYGEPRECDDYYYSDDSDTSDDSYIYDDSEERLLVHVVEQYRGYPSTLAETRHVGQPKPDSPPSIFAAINHFNFFSSKRPRPPAPRFQLSLPRVPRLNTPPSRPSRTEPPRPRRARTQPSSSRPSKSSDSSSQNPKSDPIRWGTSTTPHTRRVTPPLPPCRRRRTTRSNRNPRPVNPARVASPEITPPKRSTTPPPKRSTTPPPSRTCRRTTLSNPQKVTPASVPSPEITPPKRKTTSPLPQRPPTKPSKALPARTKPFTTCEVCADEITTRTSLIHHITTKCTHPLHWICKPCLQESLRVQAESKHPDATACPQPLAIHDLHLHLNASAPVFRRLEAFATAKLLDSLPNYATCANRHCRNGVLVETTNNALESFTCPACGIQTCIACKTEAHPGKTHVQNMHMIVKGRRRASPERLSWQKQEEAETARVAGEAKSCPNPRCGIKIQKTSWCDLMHCSKCKYGFCWTCLAQWDDVHAQSNTSALSGAPHHLEAFDFGFEGGAAGGFEGPELFAYGGGMPFGGGRMGPRRRRVVIGHEFPFEGWGIGGGGYGYEYGRFG